MCLETNLLGWQSETPTTLHLSILSLWLMLLLGVEGSRTSLKLLAMPHCWLGWQRHRHVFLFTAHIKRTVTLSGKVIYVLNGHCQINKSSSGSVQYLKEKDLNHTFVCCHVLVKIHQKYHYVLQCICINALTSTRQSDLSSF